MDRTTGSASITVVIPTHNRCVLLRDAIQSVLDSPLVASARSIVVVDDGSKDDTQRVASSFGVRYLRVSAGGPSGARNAGLAEAQTEFVCFLDDDDCWVPGNMQAQLEALRDAPACAYAFGRAQMTRMNLEPVGDAYPVEPRSGFVVRDIILRPPQLGSVLFRTDLIRSEGGFDPDLRYGEDVDLLVRLAARHPVVGLNVVGSFFRQREASCAEIEMRWREHFDVKRLYAKWRKSRLPLPRAALLTASLRYGGRASYFFCENAQAAASEGRMRDALRCVSYALRAAPLQSLMGHRQLYRALASVAGYALT